MLDIPLGWDRVGTVTEVAIFVVRHRIRLEGILWQMGRSSMISLGEGNWKILARPWISMSAWGTLGHSAIILRMSVGLCYYDCNIQGWIPRPLGQIRFSVKNTVLSTHEKGMKQEIIVREAEGNNALSSMRGSLLEAVTHRILTNTLGSVVVSQPLTLQKPPIRWISHEWAYDH